MAANACGMPEGRPEVRENRESPPGRLERCRGGAAVSPKSTVPLERATFLRTSKEVGDISPSTPTGTELPGRRPRSAAGDGSSSNLWRIRRNHNQPLVTAAAPIRLSDRKMVRTPEPRPPIYPAQAGLSIPPDFRTKRPSILSLSGSLTLRPNLGRTIKHITLAITMSTARTEKGGSGSVASGA